MSELLPLLGAATSLVSVLASGLIAALSLRETQRESANRRSHEFLLSVLPRRLNAFERTWRAIYELEAGKGLAHESLEDLVECSIWLPRSLRVEFMLIIASPDRLDHGRVAALRKKIEVASGSAAIDDIQNGIANHDIKRGRKDSKDD